MRKKAVLCLIRDFTKQVRLGKTRAKYKFVKLSDKQFECINEDSMYWASINMSSVNVTFQLLQN